MDVLGLDKEGEAGYLVKRFTKDGTKMKTKNDLLVLAGLMLAWAGAASAELTVSWTGERQGVARAVVAGETEPTEAEDAKEETEKTDGAEDDAEPITHGEYLESVARVEGEIAVDELSRRMVDGLLGPSDDGEGSQYGESTLPGSGADGDVRLAGMIATHAGTAKNGGASFVAVDTSAAEVYKEGEMDWLGKDGGIGFGAWQAKGDTTVTRSLDASGGFYMKAGADGGEIAMIRSLETAEGVPVSLESGQFTVREWGVADEAGDFLGFAVYGSSDGTDGSELIRWGVRLATIEGKPKPVSSFEYSTDGGTTYKFIKDGYPTSGGVDYTLTWAQLGGTMHFTLSAADIGTGSDRFSDYTVDVETSSYVMAIAAVLTESGQETAGGLDGSEMTFDNPSVTGKEPTPAVPEPGVLGLLAAGAAALFRRKAKKAK